MANFTGVNAAYVLELYERYRESPDSVDAHTRDFFADWSPAVAENGVSAALIDGASPQDLATAVELQKAMAVANYASSIRQFGHLDARLDPLDDAERGDPELHPEFHGLTLDDLRALPASLVGGPISESGASALEAIEALREVYCGAIGYDNAHVREQDERLWLREAAESRRYRPNLYGEEGVALLEELTRVEGFEQFLTRYLPKYRFSIEGLDIMVPMLNSMVSSAANTGTDNVIIAMAHRGRLNVLTHVMEKPYQVILAEFEDELSEDAIGTISGDVKYHMGYRRQIHRGETTVKVVMPFNPSHLEAVDPVAAGMGRAAGTSFLFEPGESQYVPQRTLQILIHGDAAFPGQGVVAETFNMANLKGYTTGGNVHIIANNQLGFTTHPSDARSTRYASDLAKGFEVPVIHVNADDPVACMEVARIAFAYQARFERDILIDLIGYRRYGHNELDEPAFTQPVMYHKIRSHPTVRQLWARALAEENVLTPDAAEAMLEAHRAHLQDLLDKLPPLDQLIAPLPPLPARGTAMKVETAVSEEALQRVNTSLAQTIPDSFNFTNVRLKQGTLRRRELFNDPGEKMIEWPAAEELALATLLAEGTPVRLTGQDVERGTFSHRHAVLTDARSGERLVPLQAFKQARASFAIHNSPLSEAAALGFEYGFNIQQPKVLVMWEAQYGDFNNNAQVIIDEFLVSAREKWRVNPSLVLLLPHGYEGRGPDHSSGRLERWLQLAAKFNIRIVNCTSAAQYFHVLRRQALLLEADPLPLVVMTPKSLLRSPLVMSSANDLIHGRWQPVIDDADVDPEQVTRLVMCSGKFYFDLIAAEDTKADGGGKTYRETHPHVAIVRVEQLYAFPVEALKAVIARYPNVKEIIWAQEEPKNMGAWEYIGWRLARLVDHRVPVRYAGRRRSSSPAEGSTKVHMYNQAIAIDAVYNHQYA
jgi:2-oxoglutarate dehydrogenase E1 component